MLLVLIGCEYSGTTTLAEAIARQFVADVDATSVRVHDHWVAPYLTDQDPSKCYLVGPDGRVPEPERYGELGGEAELSRLTEERARDASDLKPWVVEQMQRTLIWRHLHPDAYRDAAHTIQVNFYYGEAVYAPLYYGYGGTGSFADRSRRAQEWDTQLLHVVPNAVLVLLRATPEAIRARSANDQYLNAVVPDGDVELVLRRFEDEFANSTIPNKLAIDTSTASVDESVDKLLAFVASL